MKQISFFLIWILFPIQLFAAEDKLSEILNGAVEYAQSGPARGFCLLAIIGAGYLWLGRGMLPKNWAISIIGGSGFIFGASYIATNVLGL